MSSVLSATRVYGSPACAVYGATYCGLMSGAARFVDSLAMIDGGPGGPGGGPGFAWEKKG